MSSFRLIGASAILGLPALLLIAHFLWQWAPHPGVANELTVSNAVFFDQNKLNDLILIPALVLAQVAGAILVLGLHRFLPPGPPAAQSVARLRLWSGLAFWCAVFTALIAGMIPLAGSLCVILVIVAIHWRYSDDWEKALIKAAIISLGTVLAANNLLGLGLGTGLAAGLLAVLAGCLPGQAGRSSFELAYLAASAAICLMAAMTAPIFWFPGRTLASWTVLDVQVTGFAAAAFVLTLRKALQPQSSDETWTSAPALLPLAIGLSLFVLPGHMQLGISPDDYHFGEKLLAVRALFHDGDFVTGLMPAHGWSDALGGIAGRLGGDTGASGVMWGDLLVQFFGQIAILYLLLRILPGAPGLALAVVLPLPHITSSYTPLPVVMILLPALCLLRPLWLAGALATTVSVGAIFLGGGMGIAAAVSGFTGLAVAVLLRERKDFAPFALGTLTAAIVIVAIFFPRIHAWAEYLLVSASVNQSIYSIGAFVPPISIGTLNEHVFVFLPSVAFLAALATDYAVRRDRVSLFRTGLTALPVAILVLLVNSYVMTRVDYGYSRAMIVTVVATLLFVSTLRVANPAIPRTLISGLAFLPLAALYFTNPAPAQYIYARPAEVQLAPFPRVPGPVEDQGFQFGYAIDSPDHLARLSAIRHVFRTRLEPGEEFLNLTNRSAIAFYLDHSSAGYVTSVYNSGPAEFQRRTLEQMGSDLPRLALVSAANIEHDGFTLPLRSFAYYRLLLDNYLPFENAGIVYGWRKDLPQPESQPISFAPVNLSDGYWSNGVAREGNSWSFFVSPQTAAQIGIGDLLDFSDGYTRTVLDTQGLNIRTDGPPLDPAGSEKNRFQIRGRQLANDVTAAWNELFALQNYGSLPSSWGRSLDVLEDKMEVMAGPLNVTPSIGLEPDGEVFQPVTPDPQWEIQLAGPVDPAAAGLLKLEFRCDGPPAVPVQIFWRTAAEGYSELRSFRFAATYPTNLVPLDAVPNWYLSEPVTGIRVDIGQNDQQCTSINPPAAMLFRRKPLIDTFSEG